MPTDIERKYCEMLKWIDEMTDETIDNNRCPTGAAAGFAIVAVVAGVVGFVLGAWFFR